MEPRRLLIVFHSQGGSAERMAAAVVRGARRADGVQVRSVPARDATLDDLLWAEAVIFGTPENFGYMSGALKDFFDRTFYPAQGRVSQMPYALFVKAGNDGSGAVTSVERIVRGYPLKKVADPLIVRGEVGDDDLARCEELGETVAAGLALGIF
ncbi:NAD(P)H-dependent oxidoreductase [Candidatus Binatia bacterium]|jgi:multimeric flavodoxin WrbA|nr:NAD(P)H-dependent oxidoreductase [Candidatus Binatia bacterium]